MFQGELPSIYFMGEHSLDLRMHQPLKRMLYQTRRVSAQVLFLSVLHWNAVRMNVLWHGHSCGFILQHIRWESQQAPGAKQLLVEPFPQTRELIYVSLLFGFFSSLYQGCADHPKHNKMMAAVCKSHSEQKRWLSIPKHQICYVKAIWRDNVLTTNVFIEPQCPFLVSPAPYGKKGVWLASQRYQGFCFILRITEFVISKLTHDARNKARSCKIKGLISLPKTLGNIYFNSCSLPDQYYRTCEKVKDKELNSSSVPSQYCISRKLEKQNIYRKSQ